MVQNNDNKKEGYSAAAYLVAAATLAAGVVLTALYDTPHPTAVGMVLAVIEMVIYIATEIHHKRSIKTMQTQGKIEVNKIAATKSPTQLSNVIDGTARPVPNVMPPKPQPQLEYRRLLDGDDEARYLPRQWTYRISNGSIARGDVIEAIIAASHDNVETNLTLRDYIRTKYKMEFGNEQYSRALTALVEEGAMDKSGDWLIDVDDTPDLLDRMRSHVMRLKPPSPTNRA